MGFVFLTRGISFYGLNTMNEKQVCIASGADKWRWPSDMHRNSDERARMKDVLILSLALMQRLLRDKKSDYPLVTLCALANALSAILIYLVSFHYWGSFSALLVCAFYLTSVWPWQIALMGGHICLGQMVFMLSIFFLQQAELATTSYQMVAWFFASGATFVLTQFSSASSRKFIPLFMASFLFSQRFWLNPHNLWFKQAIVILPRFLLILLFLGIVFFIVRLISRPLVWAIYSQQAPAFLNKYIRNRQGHPKEYYLNVARKLIRIIAYLSFSFAVFIFLCAVFLGRHSMYLSFLPFMVGIFSACAILLWPDFIGNLKGYLSYFFISKTPACHLSLYEKYFAGIGRPIKKNMRGAGVAWIIKYFSLIARYQSLAYLLCLALVLVWGILGKNIFWEVLAIILLSLSPILWAELTGAPQLGRSYLPGSHGQLVLIGFTTMLIQQSSLGITQPLFLCIMAILVIVNLVRNYKLFFNDVFPARMVVTFMVKELRRLNVKKFYTYDTPFNDSLVKTINPEELKDFQIEFIDSIKEVVNRDNAVVVVPQTSSKAAYMESGIEGYTNQDFRSDLILNTLIDTHKIEDCVIARFKTFGTSIIWPHESEATSYRALIIKEISDEDRWRGNAWIISMKKARGILDKI